MRNMKSIGINLERWTKQGLLQFHATRPTFYSLEMHLTSIHATVERHKPSVVIFDPVTNLQSIGPAQDVHAMLMRVIDYLKASQTTALFTSLTSNAENPDQSEVGISSLMDSWLLVRNLESGGERNRALYVLKSRGVAHSNQVREFLITDQGLDLVQPYLGLGSVLTGSARVAQEARERALALEEQQKTKRWRVETQRKQKAINAQIAALRAEAQDLEDSLKSSDEQETIRREAEARERSALSRMRGS